MNRLPIGSGNARPSLADPSGVQSDLRYGGVPVEDRRPLPSPRGPVKPCFYEGCREGAKAHGLCEGHLAALVAGDERAAEAVRFYYWVVQPSKHPWPKKPPPRKTARRRGLVRLCEEPGCTRIHFCRGKCHMHYQRWFTRTHRTVTDEQGKRHAVAREA